MVNLKGLTAPLTEKIESLTELLQELIDDIKEQKIIQQKILDKLNVCKNKENNELSDNPDK
tara:strand:+ start:42 stop:224 length:183 start_codon:yes stop_codon:yes gene_type:complete